MIYLDRWLVSSVGIALHRCRRGHGFKSGKGLNFFFQVLFSTTRFSSVLSCEDLLISIHPFVSVIHTSQSAEQLKISHRANECSVWQQADCPRCGKTRVTKARLILLLNDCEYMKIVFFFRGHGNESCNLIGGSLRGPYFPISAHGHDNAFVSRPVHPYLRCHFS